MNISIIGTGIYSTALAINIARNNHQITMWSENQELVANFQKNHDLKSITNVKIPSNISLTNDLHEITKDPDLILIATSAKYVRNICEKINYISKDIPICIASKGIENDTCSFLSDIVFAIINSKNIGVISGPTFAIDLLNAEPCALSLAVNTTISENIILKALSNTLLKLKVNHELIGTEICGSIKNVIAIASGILEGLDYHDSSKCFLITESINDIKILLQKLNCDPKIILSFAGIGDLVLTCSSSKSRNYKLGLLIGQKENKETIAKYLEENTTEGYYTLFSLKKLLAQKNISLPIIDIIYDIVINNKNPEILSEFLLNKD